QTSDMKDLEVKTVKRGQAVTMECNISGVRNKENVAWYRQSLGKMPHFMARIYGKTYLLADGFNDTHFSFTINDHQFDFNIKEIREDDGGEYFCTELEGSNLKFKSGTRLQFE
ncbi:putative immune-type receptor 7 precursor, partial [Clarias magur]